MKKTQEQINTIWESIARIGKEKDYIEDDVRHCKQQLLKTVKEGEVRDIQNHLNGIDHELIFISKNIDEIKENLDLLLKHLKLEIEQVPKSKRLICYEDSSDLDFTNPPTKKTKY